MKIAGGQRLVHLLAQCRVKFHILVGLMQIQETRAAWHDHFLSAVLSAARARLRATSE